MDDRKKNPHPPVFFLLVALAVHLWLLSRHLPADFQTLSTEVNSSQNPIEITPAEDLPVVATERSHDSSSKKEKAKYAGEFTQRVEKQTRSAKVGPLRQRSGMFAEAEPRFPQDERGEEGEKRKAPRLHDLMDPGSSPNEVSDSIALGDRTLLDTDEVFFASFLNRIADEIYQPWSSYLREAMQEYAVTGRKLSAREYITRLGIEMNESGRVTAIRILKSSGVTELDEAPKRAFWERDPFPNPPERMRRPDGSFQFVYEFHFELNTSRFSIIPSAI